MTRLRGHVRLFLELALERRLTLVAEAHARVDVVAHLTHGRNLASIRWLPDNKPLLELHLFGLILEHGSELGLDGVLDDAIRVLVCLPPHGGRDAVGQVEAEGEGVLAGWRTATAEIEYRDLEFDDLAFTLVFLTSGFALAMFGGRQTRTHMGSSSTPSRLNSGPCSRIRPRR